MSVHEIVAVVQKIFHTLEFVGDIVNLTTRKTTVVHAMFEMTILNYAVFQVTTLTNSLFSFS